MGAERAAGVMRVAVASGDAHVGAIQRLPPFANAGEATFAVQRVGGVVDQHLGEVVEVGVHFLGGDLLRHRRAVAMQRRDHLLRVQRVPPAHGHLVVGRLRKCGLRQRNQQRQRTGKHPHGLSCFRVHPQYPPLVIPSRELGQPHRQSQT